MPFERAGRAQGGRPCRLIEDKGAGAGTDNGRAFDLHPFAAFGPLSDEDAPASPAAMDTGEKETGAMAPAGPQRRRFPSMLRAPPRPEPRGARERRQFFAFGAFPWRDHAHRSFGLRPFDPHVFALAGEFDRPGEDAFAQRPRLARAPFRGVGRAQRHGGREGDVDQAQLPEADFQPFLGDLGPSRVDDSEEPLVVLAGEGQRRHLLFRGFEVRFEAVAGWQLEFDPDDRPLLRDRGRRPPDRHRHQ